MTDNKTEDPTEILVWKISLPKMADNAVTKFIQRSIEKNLMKEEKYLIMNFARDHIFEKRFW